jgi:hypothetical protein
MKHNLCVLPIIFATVILAINHTVNAQSDNFKTYTNKDLGFSIQHPSKWKAEADDTEVTFTIRENKEEKKDNEFLNLPASLFNSFFLVKTEKPEPYLDTDTMTVQNTSLQQRVQHELDTISFNSNEDKLIRHNPVTVGGNPGYKIEYR